MTVENRTQESALEILHTNDRGGFTVPTVGMYPYQWNWDSMFVALGFATFDEERACQEIETLFEAQWDDGFVPHIVFREDDPDYFPGPNVWRAGQGIPTSGITQPPVAASIVSKLWAEVENTEVKARLTALFPKLLAWHRWFMKYRVAQESGAVIITHPWESGRDNSPEWDQPAAGIDTSAVAPYSRRDLHHADTDMRPTKLDYDRYIALVEFGRDTGWDHDRIARTGPFRVADVGMTFMFLRATLDLISFAKETGQTAALGELDSDLRLLRKSADYLWDSKAGTFCSRDVVSGAHSGFVTSASFLYAYAGVGGEQQHRTMLEHWARIAASTEFMIPSHDPADAMFDHKRYWRGPIWIVVNYMITIGFKEWGLEEQAERIRRDSGALIRRYGFCEAFSPSTGEGTGGREFSWTAAMWLAWCGDQA